jgi:hypothetical protein
VKFQCEFELLGLGYQVLVKLIVLEKNYILKGH